MHFVPGLVFEVVKETFGFMITPWCPRSVLSPLHTCTAVAMSTDRLCTAADCTLPLARHCTLLKIQICPRADLGQFGYRFGYRIPNFDRDHFRACSLHAPIRKPYFINLVDLNGGM